MKKKNTKPKIFFKELSLEKPGKNGAVFGMVNTDGHIYIDPRQNPSEMLDTLIHEMLHVACPYMSEKNVARASEIISTAVWKKGYRIKK